MDQQQKTGKPWSASNPIPNIKQFFEKLDPDKMARDAEIDNRLAQQHDAVVPHVNDRLPKKDKKVTDPVTGKEVVIENVGRDFMKAVKDPRVSDLMHYGSKLTFGKLSVPNANLDKDTVKSLNLPLAAVC